MDRKSALQSQCAVKTEIDATISHYLDTLLGELDEPPPDNGLQVAAAIADSPYLKVEETLHLPEAGSITDGPELTHQRQERLFQQIPGWAESAFQVLLIRVNGLTLGVPLCSLVGILERRDPPSSLPGQPDWHLGIVIGRGQKVVVVDTARLIMPEKCEQMAEHSLAKGRLLLVGDGTLGLAVDNTDATLLLEKEHVSWRRGGSRPWYAGTMIERLSVLIDVDGLLGMLGPINREVMT